MLLQAQELQTAVCLFDIINGNQPDPIQYTQDIENFRNSSGSNGLKYGISYYPFIGTTVMGGDAVDFTNLFGGDTKQLAALVDPAYDYGLLFRDLGPAALPPGDHLEPGIRERAAFFARCSVLEDLAYGVETGRKRYADKSTAALTWLFPHAEVTPEPSGGAR